MRRRLARTLPVVACAFALLVAAAGPAGAQSYGGEPAQQGGGEKAAEKPAEPAKKKWGKKKDKKFGKTDTLSPRVAKHLAKVQEFLQAEKIDEAAAELAQLKPKGLKPFERSRYYFFKGFVAYGKGDVKGARAFFEQSLADNALSPEDAAPIRLQIAQLYMQEQNWAAAIKSLDAWFKTVEAPTSTAYYLLAVARFQNEDIDGALEPAIKAVELADAPSEASMQLLLAIRLNRKEYEESIPILEQLLARYPKRLYWVQLSTIYGALSRFDDAVIPLQLASTQGELNEPAEIRRLAQLLLYLDLPLPAAQLLQRRIEEGKLKPDDAEAFELLANGWIVARDYERSLAPLEHAAKLSPKGELFVRLAQVRIQREEWKEATDALQKAIAKGGLTSPGDAKVLMGIALYSNKDYVESRSWFQRATEHPETAAEANAWLQQVEVQIAAAAPQQ